MNVVSRVMLLTAASGIIGVPVVAQAITAGSWTGSLDLSSGVSLNVELSVLPAGMTMSVVGGGSGPVTETRVGDRDFAFVWGVFECALARRPDTMRGQCTASDGTTGTLDLSAPTGDLAEDATARNDVPRDAVVRAQLVETGAVTLHDAIRRLRPRWLRARGEVRISGNARVRVYVNRQPMGGVEALQQMQPGDVSYVHFLNAADATFEFGTDNDGGVIVVVTHR